MKKIRVLALSGSLRKNSYNTSLLSAASRLSPDDIELVIFDQMARLPLFNPDRENESIPSVMELKNELRKSHGLIVSSPEYAHGISGVMKNALDWLVSGEEFPYMPVVLYNTSPRASHAQAALREVILTMSGTIIESASMNIPLLGTNMDVDGIIKNNKMAHHIIDKLKLFKDEIVRHKST